MPEEIQNLTQLLQQLDHQSPQRDRFTLGQIILALGQRSFGPLLLLAGLILFSPLSGIPGVPTLMGLLVLLASLQLLFLRHHLWLPDWLLRRSISAKKFRRVLRWLHRPASVVDQWLRPRLPLFVHRAGAYVIAIQCTAIALALPVMEIVPFSASIAGIALAAFGLALVAHDGLLAIIAFIVTCTVPALIAHALM
ncbi:exopolysaccharide biosynthesis protein [Microbulbifer sp. SA54]|uniref:exopolysaccharide biosynthesis protein n=1 Tax=Microbulbifer sp. SA54 TaxID=3401577 RepID=UPI003AB09B67